MSDDFDFQEILLTCSICGKQVKMVVYKGFDTSDFVCQRCSAGEFGEEQDDAGDI